MSEALSFSLRIRRGSSFTLDMEERIPLQGVTAIVGPSGSGKTTFLRALAGLDRDAGGQRRITVGTTDWDGPAGHVPTETRQIGFVFQEPALFPHLTVEGNLRYGARRRGVTSLDAIVDALELGPLLSRGVVGLSGGEQRRVALGRALAADPRLLLLDEPMSGLDSARKADLLPYIARAVAEARVPAIYVSHSWDEILTLADRVLDIDEGRIRRWRTPPMRLYARCIGDAPGGVMLKLEGADEAGVPGEIAAPLRAERGERIGLALAPDGLLLSTDHPGAGNARLVLPAKVADAAAREIEVLGQTLALPQSLPLPGPGRLWLSVLRIYPRREWDDSPP